MKIVVLEGDSLGKDLDWSVLNRFGEVKVYGKTKQEQVRERIQDADIIVPNKTLIGKDVLENSAVQMVCEAATGFNNVDVEYCGQKGIRVTNVAGYSTDSVAGHTVAMVLALYEKLSFYNDYVKSGKYSAGGCFSYVENYFHEVAGRTWGIVGMGAIGKKTAEIATALGAKVVYYSASGNTYDVQYKCVDFQHLLSQSHIISIHCPLSEKTMGIFNDQAFDQMMPEAVLVNVARGPVVQNLALANALREGKIAAAGLDVFEVEPIAADDPLMSIEDSDKLIMTPHIGWGTVEARQRLMKEIEENIDAFLNGKRRSVII